MPMCTWLYRCSWYMHRWVACWKMEKKPGILRIITTGILCYNSCNNTYYNNRYITCYNNINITCYKNRNITCFNNRNIMCYINSNITCLTTGISCIITTEILHVIATGISFDILCTVLFAVFSCSTALGLFAWLAFVFPLSLYRYMWDGPEPMWADLFTDRSQSRADCL